MLLEKQADCKQGRSSRTVCRSRATIHTSMSCAAHDDSTSMPASTTLQQLTCPLEYEQYTVSLVLSQSQDSAMPPLASLLATATGRMQQRSACIRVHDPSASAVAMKDTSRASAALPRPGSPLDVWSAPWLESPDVSSLGRHLASNTPEQSTAASNFNSRSPAREIAVENSSICVQLSISVLLAHHFILRTGRLPTLTRKSNVPDQCVVLRYSVHTCTLQGGLAAWILHSSRSALASFSALAAEQKLLLFHTESF
jgi:hypothetical protein